MLPGDRFLPPLDRTTFLVPRELTVTQFPSGRRHSAQGDVCCVCPGLLEQEDLAEGDGEEFQLCL